MRNIDLENEFNEKKVEIIGIEKQINALKGDFINSQEEILSLKEVLKKAKRLYESKRFMIFREGKKGVSIESLEITLTYLNKSLETSLAHVHYFSSVLSKTYGKEHRHTQKGLYKQETKKLREEIRDYKKLIEQLRKEPDNDPNKEEVNLENLEQIVEYRNEVNSRARQCNQFPVYHDFEINIEELIKDQEYLISLNKLERLRKLYKYLGYAIDSAWRQPRIVHEWKEGNKKFTRTEAWPDWTKRDGIEKQIKALKDDLEIETLVTEERKQQQLNHLNNLRTGLYKTLENSDNNKEGDDGQRILYFSDYYQFFIDPYLSRAMKDYVERSIELWNYDSDDDYYICFEDYIDLSRLRIRVRNIIKKFRDTILEGLEDEMFGEMIDCAYKRRTNSWELERDLENLDYGGQERVDKFREEEIEESDSLLPKDEMKGLLYD